MNELFETGSYIKVYGVRTVDETGHEDIEIFRTKEEACARVVKFKSYNCFKKIELDEGFLFEGVM